MPYGQVYLRVVPGLNKNLHAQENNSQEDFIKVILFLFAFICIFSLVIYFIFWVHFFNQSVL